VKSIYISRNHLSNKMKKGIVTSFEGIKKYPKAMWIHHFMFLQAIMKEAECTREMNLEHWKLLDGDDWSPFLKNHGTLFYGTCLCWMGESMTWHGL
jgi:hypothetical protein